MKKAVFGLIGNEEQARRVVDRLLASGFSNSDISILYPDRRNGSAARDDTVHGTIPHNIHKGNLGTEKNTKAPEGGVAGATAGGLLGGSLGLLAGIGALAIPGLGPFIAAGPIMAALSGSAIGGIVGGGLGLLVGAGIPEYEAKKYEAGLKAGNILLSVHADSDEEITRVKEILKAEGVKDISSTSETRK